MSVFASWHTQRLRRKLTDKTYDYLFEPAPHEEYVCLDCETSSLNTKTAELLCIAAVRIVKQRILLSERLELLIAPEGAIDPRSIPIHGLREQDLIQGLPSHVALAQLLRFIGSRPIVGYYIEFDLAIINRYLKPWLGIPLPNRSIEVSSLFYNKNVCAYRPEVDLSLNAMIAQLNIPNLPRHNALCDALTAGLIWLKLDNGGK